MYYVVFPYYNHFYFRKVNRNVPSFIPDFNNLILLYFSLVFLAKGLLILFILFKEPIFGFVDFPLVFLISTIIFIIYFLLPALGFFVLFSFLGKLYAQPGAWTQDPQIKSCMLHPLSQSDAPISISYKTSLEKIPWPKAQVTSWSSSSNTNERNSNMCIQMSLKKVYF